MRWLKAPDTLVFGLFCAVALLFAAPLLSDFGNWGILDWDFQLHHHAVPRVSLLEYGEFPLWNPYNRSGGPMFAHPESRVLAPGFLLSLAFGEVRGLKLEILLHLVLGMFGTYRLLRHYQTSRSAGVAGAAVFMLNSSFALHLSVGHVWALSFAYLPWILLFQRLAVARIRFSLCASLMLVLTIFSGAPYQFMIGWALIGTHAGLAVLFQRESIQRHALVITAILLQVLLLGAVKLIPTQELMSQYPRSTDAESGYSLAALGNALFDPDQSLAAARAERPEEFNATPMHEGMYVGVTASVLFLLGVLAHARKQAALLAGFLLFIWLALGSNAPLDLWSLLHRLPGYDNMRLVQRFGVVPLLLAAIFVGFGVDHLRAFASRLRLPHASQVAGAGAVLLLLIELQTVNGDLLAGTFPIEPLELAPRSEFHQRLRLPYYDAQGWIEQRRPASLPALTSLYPAVLSNQGSTVGYEIVPFASSALPRASQGYRGELHLESLHGSGVARHADYLHWSPNRMEVAVLEGPPAQLVINQNYAVGWQAQSIFRDRAEKRTVTSRRGLLGVKVRPQDRRIELRYQPKSVRLGFAVSTLAALGLSLWALWPQLPDRIRPKRS